MCSGDLRGAEEPSVDARCVKPRTAEHARAVGEGERHDDKITGLDGANVGTNGFDDADRLVSNQTAVLALFHFLIWPQTLPQMQARVTVTTASVGSMMLASGTLSIRTSPAPNMTVARIMIYLLFSAGSMEPMMMTFL